MDLSRAKRLMEEGGLDAIVASSERNVFYASGFPCVEYAIEPEFVMYSVIPASRPLDAFLVLPTAYACLMEDLPTWISNRIWFGTYYVKGLPTRPGHSADTHSRGLVTALGELGLERGRIGFELNLFAASLMRDIQGLLPQIECVDCSAIFRELRMVKSAAEIERLRRAAQVTEEALREAMRGIRPGVTERQLEQRIRQFVINAGFEPRHILGGAGQRSALSWHPSNNVIQRGQLIHIDASVAADQYVSDLARGCVVGEPTPEQERYYQATLDGQHAALAMVRPGAKISEIFRAAVQRVIEAGYTDFRRHHTGHGIGLQLHEWPFLDAKNTQVLETGMVLAVEVPYWIHGFGGVNAEDDILVTETGYEYLNPPVPEEIWVV